MFLILSRFEYYALITYLPIDTRFQIQLASFFSVIYSHPLDSVINLSKMYSYSSLEFFSEYSNTNTTTETISEMLSAVVMGIIDF